MSLIGSIFMWGFLVVAFLIVTSWPMGKESDRRAEYWGKFEGR